MPYIFYFIFINKNIINIYFLDDDEAAQEIKDKGAETIKLDCGEAYTDGKCVLGKDVENCVYKTPSDPGIQGCGGLLEIVKMPEDYKCKKQAGLYKCVKVNTLFFIFID